MMQLGATADSMGPRGRAALSQHQDLLEAHHRQIFVETTAFRSHLKGFSKTFKEKIHP